MSFDFWQRVGNHLIQRVSGPMHFRLLMQPAMALYFGIRDGLKDAREDRPAYFWSIFKGHERRWDLLKMGFRSVAKILIAAILLDAIYQLIELHWFYPGEAVIVALLLAFVPYLLIRGPANRIARRRAALNARGDSEAAKRATVRFRKTG